MAARGSRKQAAQPRTRRTSLGRKKSNGAGLQKQLADARAQQVATAEILNVIKRSPADVQPVFDAIVNNARQLLGGFSAVLSRIVGNELHVAALTHTTKAGDRALKRVFPSQLSRRGVHTDCVRGKKPLIVRDMERAPWPKLRAMARLRGYRSALAIPLMRDWTVLGVISVTRKQPGTFSGSEIKLLKTFADQAVIAIENVRLFNETRESLERQTATAEILRVISSSPTDVQPVFDAIVRNAGRVCDAVDAITFLREGEEMRNVAHLGPIRSTVGSMVPLNRETTMGRAIVDSSPIHVQDLSVAEDFALGQQLGMLNVGHLRYTSLAVPLLHGGRAVGSLLVRRSEVKPFSDKQIALLQTFADQAVIAIENVRLFNETKESLERQTATAEILKVIASSPSDVQPVFDAIAESAKRLLGAHSSIVRRLVGDTLALAAHTLTDPAGDQFARNEAPMKLAGSGTAAVAARTGAPSFVVDTEDRNADVPEVDRRRAQERGFRSLLVVPMLREGVAVGTIGVARGQPGQFSGHQIALLKTFADQAVIAIENVRLFNETREALERQTAMAEILKVISSSPTDTQPVFDTIARSAVILCGGMYANVFRFDGELLHWAASHGLDGPGRGALARKYPMRPDLSQLSGRAMLAKSLVHIEDTRSDPDYDSVLAAKWARRMLGAPMLRDGNPIGAIVVGWAEPGTTPVVQQELLQTFASQAVIAIENVRLFKELEARTEALTRSVGQLTALGEVGQAISSTLELETVLQTIVSRAVQLAGLDGGSIYEYDERSEEFHLQAAENIEEELVQAVREAPVRKGEGAIGRTALTLEPSQVADILDDSYHSGRKEILVRAGYRAILAVPLLREDHMLGALQVFRRTPGPFAPEIVELLKTFATQSAMAIQNARLFREIAEKGKQLEVASRHKSDFLSSMSHELRTPLNAILGFNEMILGDVYGEVPADMQPPLAQMQTSGKHLLRLINNVLDLAKIEAGRMELALSDYSVQDTVESVRSTLRPLAADKGLELLASAPNDIPLAYGDGGRIAQCLMNLAGNSLKFTKAGKVEISVAEKDGLLTYRVADTGIGIPPDKIANLFTEFKQTDATIASEYGGTGLGLSISKKFIEMHGGRIWVESELGKGSAFIFEVPLRAETT